MQQGSSIVSIVAGSIAGALLLWFCVLWLIATVSGWRRLAAHFASTMPFQGQINSFATARIRYANYSGVLNLGVSDWGIYLAPMRLFRPFHPALLIPWAEIEATIHGSSIRAWRGARITFPSVPRTTITLYGRAADCLLPYVVDQESADTPLSY